MLDHVDRKIIDATISAGKITYCPPGLDSTGWDHLKNGEASCGLRQFIQSFKEHGDGVRRLKSYPLHS